MIQVSGVNSRLELATAYLFEAMPRGVWPLRNGGNEALMYLVVFLFLAVCGAGALSLDSSLRATQPKHRLRRPAADIQLSSGPIQNIRTIDLPNSSRLDSVCACRVFPDDSS